MQCFMKKEDKSMIDVDNVKTTYFNNCVFFAALASFLLVLSHPSQSCLSRILCNLLHLPLWCGIQDMTICYPTYLGLYKILKVN